MAIVLLTVSVAAHHGALAMDAGMHQHDGATQVAVEFCLGVLTAVGAAVAVLAVGSLRSIRLRPPALLSAVGTTAAAPRPPSQARAGPALLNLLCISRR